MSKIKVKKLNEGFRLTYNWIDIEEYEDIIEQDEDIISVCEFLMLDSLLEDSNVIHNFYDINGNPVLLAENEMYKHAYLIQVYDCENKKYITKEPYSLSEPYKELSVMRELYNLKYVKGYTPVISTVYVKYNDNLCENLYMIKRYKDKMYVDIIELTEPRLKRKGDNNGKRNL